MSRRRRTEEEVNTPTNNHPLQQQQRIPPSFSLSTLKRWRKHILFVGLFKDTS